MVLAWSMVASDAAGTALNGSQKDEYVYCNAVPCSTRTLSSSSSSSSPSSPRLSFCLSLELTGTSHATDKEISDGVLMNSMHVFRRFPHFLSRSSVEVGYRTSHSPYRHCGVGSGAILGP